MVRLLYSHWSYLTSNKIYMKYSILELGIYKSYVCVCSVDDSEEFYETFDIRESASKVLFEDSMDNSKSFMLAGFMKVHSKLLAEDEEYEQRAYFIIHNSRDRDTIKITHGILAHEILHIVQSISNSLENEVGMEAESYLIGSITDFAYGFFRDNEIPVYYVEDIMITPLDKHKDKIKHPIMY